MFPNHRTHDLCDRNRNFLPDFYCLSKRLLLFFSIRNILCSIHQDIVPIQRTRAYAPLFLEPVSSFIGRGPAEIKVAVATVASVFQHTPVQQHIRGKTAILSKRRWSWILAYILEANSHATGDRFSVLVDHNNAC